MLPAIHRLTKSKDFVRTTKTGVRAQSTNLVAYITQNIAHPLPKPQPTIVGFIINKSIGGSVERHRIARQLRHLMKYELENFPPSTMVVIRVLRNEKSYQTELHTLITSLKEKFMVTSLSRSSAAR